MNATERLAQGFPDLSRMPVARQPHWMRWFTATAILAVLAVIGRAFANGQIEWSYVGRFLTVPAILEGISNTMIMAALAMALGILLGVVVAVMRLSSNQVLKSVAAGYTWLFRGTPLILQLLLWFNLALVFPTIGIPGLWSVRAVDVTAGVSDHRHSRPVVGAGGRCDDAVPVGAARPRYQPGRLHVRSDAGGHPVCRRRAI
ncbi:MAG: amino acid transporter permease [Tardiphaga sp.]|nr:amino acid transporter permease [Tardiphaga sp.]